MKLKFRSIYLRQLIFLIAGLIFSAISVCGANERVVDAKESKLYMTIIGERDVDVMYTKAKKLIVIGEHDVNALIRNKGKISNSILGAAVSRQHLPLVKLILEHGANPSPALEYGCGPIGIAITYANQTVIKSLIISEVDLSLPACYYKGPAGNTALHQLLISPLVEDSTRIFAVEKYTEKGGEWPSLLLHRMLRKNKYEVAKRMLELQPTAINDSTRKIITKSKNNKTRSLLELLPNHQLNQSTSSK